MKSQILYSVMFEIGHSWDVKYLKTLNFPRSWKNFKFKKVRTFGTKLRISLHFLPQYGTRKDRDRFFFFFHFPKKSPSSFRHLRNRVPAST